MKKPLSQRWDLDVFFQNGSNSAEFADFLTDLQSQVQTFTTKLSALDANATIEAWRETYDLLQTIGATLRHSGAFISCLISQDVKDQKAKLLQGRVQQISAAYLSAQTKLDKAVLSVSEDKWQGIITDEYFQPIAFALEERRRRAGNKLPAEQEALLTDLSVDGYHAWGTLYGNIVGRMTAEMEKDGELVEMSMGQLQNMISHEDRDVRATAFAKYEGAFAKESEMIAASLNNLAGFRIQAYKHRGWDSVLAEPLDYNRMTEQTLNVMWEVIDRNKPKLVEFLNRKAELLGLNKMTWYDMYAPVGTATGKMSYDEGAAFIVEHFRKFDENMADFAVRAFEEAWIEAEDRAGKRPGGFCTSFPLKHQSRIFMTYDGSPSSVSTLAHELGHAYHQHVMNDLPQAVQGYAMNVAETASTFAEMIVSDAAVKTAATTEERLTLLEDKIQRAVAFFMDIHCRFLFETRFYDERKKGLVSVEKLNDLMETAQKEAFSGALDSYHPYFWASKLHFYSTSVPFYNFPYTFGYLFSTGVYAQALQEGPAFAQKYVDLLRDTARVTTEELASRHLGVDLTKPEFWQSAVDVVLEDVEEFLRLTEGLKTV